MAAARFAPYGYRRVTRTATSPAHLEIYEPEATVVRRIFGDYVSGGHSTREITRRLNADGVATPTGKRAVWGTSTIGRLLRNEAYVGRVYWNKTESVPNPRPGRAKRQIARPRAEWIEIPTTPIIDDSVFEAAGWVSRDNSKWSPRNAEPGAWLLRSLVRCGTCGVGVNCHKMRGRDGTIHRYYYCRNHDPLRAGGQDRRCRERNIRSDELDSFVFDQVRAALRRPDVLLAGEQAVTATAPAPDDELLAAQLGRLERNSEAADAERRRLADLYQAGLIELVEVQRRARELDDRRTALAEQRQALASQRAELATGNRLRQRITAFTTTVSSALDRLDFEQRQKLLRLIVEEVRVTGWNVELRLRIRSTYTIMAPPAIRSALVRAGARPAAPPPRSQCQAMTVCVPLVTSSWAADCSRSMADWRAAGRPGPATQIGSRFESPRSPRRDVARRSVRSYADRAGCTATGASDEACMGRATCGTSCAAEVSRWPAAPWNG